MGLLDDAIREHLELKRLRGADPGEVAREQREALDPVPRDRHGGQDDHGELDDGSAALDDGGKIGENEVASGGLREVDGHGAPEPPPGGDFSHVGQETAELDMRTVLGEGLSAPQDDPVPALAGSDGHEIQADGHAPEDSLEWEAPGEPSGELAVDSARHDHPGDAEGSTEDVLEETPDFLRDTPEQDRLWFEQQPPRDFDFDK
jgi:hypothetical protein